MEAAFLHLYKTFASRIEMFIGVSLVASIGYLVVCWVIRPTASGVVGKQWPTSFVWFVLGAGVIFRLTAIGIGPVASGDVFRYVWDGNVMAHGLNPYAYAPTDPALNHLHSENLPAILEFAAMPTIYPPFTEWVFAASYLLFGEQVLGIKLFLLLAECLTLWLLVLVLRESGRSPMLVALYALCPLPVLQFMTDAHADALAFPALVLMFLLWYRRKETGAFFAAGVAVLFKLMPALAIPVLWRHAPKNRKLAAIVIPGALIGLLYLPYILWQGHPFDALGAYSARWYFNGIIFDGLLVIVGSNELTHLIMLVLFGGWFLYCLFVQAEPSARLMRILTGFFLLSATVHPWYITWLAVLLPLSFSWSAVVWLCTINLANIVYIDYLSGHVWHLPIGWEILEYAPVIILFGWEIYKSRHSEHTLPISVSNQG